MNKPGFAPELQEVEDVNKSGYLNYAVDREIGARIAAYWSRWKWWVLAFATVVAVPIGLKAWDVNDLVKTMTVKTAEAEDAVAMVRAIDGKITKAAEDSSRISKEVAASAVSATQLAATILEGNKNYLELSTRMQKDIAESATRSLERVDSRITTFENDARAKIGTAVAEVEQSRVIASQNAEIAKSLLADLRKEYDGTPHFEKDLETIRNDFNRLEKRFPDLRAQLSQRETDVLAAIAKREGQAVKALEDGKLSTEMKDAIARAVEEEMKKQIKHAVKSQ